MPSTVVHALLPSSCWALVREKELRQAHRRKRIAYFVVAACLANLPDLDVIPAYLFSSHFDEIHRAWGHNIFSLIFWAWIGVKLLRKYVFEDLDGIALWCTSAFLVGSHAFLDALGQFNPWNSLPSIPLFWPLSRTVYRLPWRVFGTLTLRDPRGHFWPYVTLPQILEQIFFREVIPALGLFLTWWCVLNCVHLLKSAFSWRRVATYRGRATLN